MESSMVKFQKKGQAPQFFPNGINYNGYLVLFLQFGVDKVGKNKTLHKYTQEELIMSPFFDFDKMTHEELIQVQELRKSGVVTIFDVLNNNLEHTLVKFESNERYICLNVKQEMDIRKNFNLN